MLAFSKDVYSASDAGVLITYDISMKHEQNAYTYARARIVVYSRVNLTALLLVVVIVIKS